MADLVARESMKDLHNILRGSPRPRRRSLLALTEGHFSFGYVRRDYCVAWQNEIASCQPSDVLSGESFGRWLEARGLSNNMSSRIMYMATLIPDQT